LKAELKQKIKKIKLLVLDVDGILTDGKIIYDHKGNELKEFNVKDGFGIVIFNREGFKTAVITARSTVAVQKRCEDLKIHKIYQNAYPKLKVYKMLLGEMKLVDSEVCFMGDDLPDLAVLKQVGFSVSVPNGVAEVKSQVDYVTKNLGGQGAVREVIEIILKTQGKWKQLVKSFS